MRTSFSLLARETPRTCAVSAGEAKSVVMTALAIASSDNNRLSSIPSILMSNLAARFRRRTSAVESAYSLVLGYVVHQDDLVHTVWACAECEILVLGDSRTYDAAVSKRRNLGTANGEIFGCVLRYKVKFSLDNRYIDRADFPSPARPKNLFDYLTKSGRNSRSRSPHCDALIALRTDHAFFSSVDRLSAPIAST